MYEEIDMDNLTTILAPVIAVPTTQSYLPLSNGTSSSLNSTTTTLTDIGGAAALNVHSHSSTYGFN